jgi:hypothetical protein
MYSENNWLKSVAVAVVTTCLIWIVVLWAKGAFAQDADTPPPPVATSSSAVSLDAPKKFWLEVDQNDLNAISQALMELPKKIADPLVLKLNAQLQAQAKIVENKDATAEKPKKGKK